MRMRGKKTKRRMGIAMGSGAAVGERGFFYFFFGRGQWGGRGDAKAKEGMCCLFVSVARGRVTTAAISPRILCFERSGTHGRIYLCVVLTLNT